MTNKVSPRDNIPGRKPFSPERRCHWFDVSGRPYKRLDGGLGCPRNKMCYFAHPSDGDKWRDARASGEPPLHYLTDDEYRLIVGRHRSPGRLPATRPPQPYQPRRRSVSIERDRRSPPRRYERSPPPGVRPRSKSRERERVPDVSLVSRIRRRSASREGREVRPYGYRNSRSRSPTIRGRIQPRTPPPIGGPSRPPPSRTFGTVPDGPRNGPYGRPRSPVVFPKVETLDISMKDLMARPHTIREDSISSSHVPSHRPTPSRIPTGPAAMIGGSSSHHAPSTIANVAAKAAANILANTATNTGSASNTASSTNTASKGLSINVESTTTAKSSVNNGSSAMDIVPSSAAPTNTTPGPDTISSLLESSAAQWQQISSAVAAATSAVPKNNMQTSGSGDLDDSQKIWTSRIELLAAAMRILNDCRSMENDIQDYKKLSESFNYQRLDEEDRTVLGGHAHTLELQLAQKTDELKRILTQLAAAKFWPTHTHRRAPSPADDGARQQELVGLLHTLSGSVAHLQGLLRAADARWEQLLAQLRDSASADANAFLAEAIVPPELARAREALAGIEGRLATLERDVAQQAAAYAAELDAIVAENVQAVALATTGAVQAHPPEPRGATLSDEQLRTLQTLQENAAATGQQVVHLSQEVQQLAAHNDALKTENLQLQAETAQLRQQLEEAQHSQSASGDTGVLDRIQAEMRALNAAVKVLISQIPNQQAAQTSDAIVKQLTPLIAKTVGDAVASGLQNVQSQFQESLRAQQVELLEELESKMMSIPHAAAGAQGLADKTQDNTALNDGPPSQSDSTEPMDGVQ